MVRNSVSDTCTCLVATLHDYEEDYSPCDCFVVEAAEGANFLQPSVSKVSGSRTGPRPRVVIALKQLTQPPVLDQTSRNTLIFKPIPLYSTYRSHLRLQTLTDSQIWPATPELCFVRWGTPLDTATRQITDIEVSQQAETSLQKASGGFSFFGGRQEKCKNGFAVSIQLCGFTNARDRRGSSRTIHCRSKCVPHAEDG